MGILDCWFCFYDYICFLMFACYCVFLRVVSYGFAVCLDLMLCFCGFVYRFAGFVGYLVFWFGLLL